MKMHYFNHVSFMSCAFVILGLAISACTAGTAEHASADEKRVIAPRVITDPVPNDSDDPAIWVHPTDPSRSLIIGTDKHANGGLYVFDLQGRLLQEKSVRGLNRPNNVDVAYGLQLGSRRFDIAVATERYENRIRIFSLPDMQPVDNGGIPVFDGEDERAPMGIAMYTRLSDGATYAIVGRKDGPTDGTYLWQYRLEDDGTGNLAARKVRAFGMYSGDGEIEAIAVDNELGYVYYSDELYGVRKYHADPDAPNVASELAVFGKTEFKRDREGISIYKNQDGTGYIIISDQQANRFQIYTREGSPGDPHDHRLLKTVYLSTDGSDGSDVTSAPLGSPFPNGMFVAMSEDGVFHLYDWADIAGAELTISRNAQIRNTTTR